MFCTAGLFSISDLLAPGPNSPDLPLNKPVTNWCNIQTIRWNGIVFNRSSLPAVGRSPRDGRPHPSAERSTAFLWQLNRQLFLHPARFRFGLGSQVQHQLLQN